MFQVPVVHAYDDTVLLAAGPGGQGQGGQGGGGGGQGGSGGGQGGGGGHEDDGEPEQGNNLSFPAIAADGYVITPIATTSLTVAYDGPYTGLSADDQLVLEGSDWYAQKTPGNVWQAAFSTAPVGTAVAVYGVDWGDIVEAVDPVVGNPFRLEIGLYAELAESMSGYRMEMLANPSSPDEVQGTNGEQYDNDFAVIISDTPKIVVQDITNVCTDDLEWSGAGWTLDGESLAADSLTFGPELNVGGKYIYGASQGGWKPAATGMYRATMYLEESDISLSEAVIGNYADWVAGEIVAASEEEDEDGEEGATGGAAPVVDQVDNLTYVDMVAVEGAGGRRPGEAGTDTYDPCAVVVEPPATTTDPVATSTDPEVNDSSSGSRSGGGSATRIDTPTPIVAGVSISMVTQQDIDTQKGVLDTSVKSINAEYAKLVELIAAGGTQQEIDQQKALLMSRIQSAQAEYIKLLQLLLISRLTDMVAQLQN